MNKVEGRLMRRRNRGLSLGPPEAFTEHMILPGSWWMSRSSSVVSGKSTKREKHEEKLWSQRSWSYLRNCSWLHMLTSQNFGMWRLNQTSVTSSGIPFLKVTFFSYYQLLKVLLLFWLDSFLIFFFCEKCGNILSCKIHNSFSFSFAEVKIWLSLTHLY